MKLSTRLFGPRQLAACGAILFVACTSETQGLSGTNPFGSAGAAASVPGAGAGSDTGAIATGGASNGNGSGGGVAASPPPFQPGPAMLRRLTRAQFGNAIHDLLGTDVDESNLDPDSWDGNFATIGASSVVTSQNGVEQYHAAVESALTVVFADATKRSQLLGCTPSGSPSSDTCLRGFLGTIGRRAWRRPLEATELDRLLSVADLAGTTLGSPVEGAHWATVALLTSPNFLYRAELGALGADGVRRFTNYETAGRLSFLLWNSLPDAALLDAAASGALATAAGIRAAVERMLDAPNGRQAVGQFAEEYMRLDRVLSQAKDSGLFPEYDATLQTAMVRDMRGVWETVAFDDKASALSLFSTKKVIANAALAKLYGLDATGLDATTFKAFSLPDSSPRAGILSKPGFLSQFANQKEGSPTLRGKFIRDALMCRAIPPPPSNVNAMLVEPPAGQPMTKRQRLELHRSDPSCAACHALMDPLGLPLETFDAIGRYRTTENGLTIDPSGEVDGVKVADARALALAMSSNTTVAQCLVRRYYAYASGHVERDVDGSVINQLTASFQTSGYQLRNLIVDTVTHDAFSAVATVP